MTQKGENGDCLTIFPFLFFRDSDELIRIFAGEIFGYSWSSF